MFYPDLTLKRGGTFFYCWVADSWPHRFAELTRKQIMCQDICKLSDSLMEMITKESGYPSGRFSLRLSSMLMRGLVKVYQRKASFMLEELCMMNAKVNKFINKKYDHDESLPKSAKTPRARPKKRNVQIQELPDNEERFEERVQASNNIVANIADITLREEAIPEIQLPVDGFGEENPEQALELFADKTIDEMRLNVDTSHVQHSGADLMVDLGDKSKDHSKLLPLEGRKMMERPSDQDKTLFGKSGAPDELMQLDGFGEDIPQIPDIQIPDLNVPQPRRELIVLLERLPEHVLARATRMDEESVELELEELQQMENESKKRKRPKKLIVDKRIKFSKEYMRSRLENVAVELRCEDSLDEIADALRVPAQHLLCRPARAGRRVRTNISPKLIAMFRRNLGIAVGTSGRDSEIEHALARRQKTPVDQEEMAVAGTGRRERPPQPTTAEPMIIEQPDIAELPTQVLTTASQEKSAQKRSDLDAQLDVIKAAKKPRLGQSDRQSFNRSQRLAKQSSEALPTEQTATVLEQEVAAHEAIPMQEEQPIPMQQETIPMQQETIPVQQETIPVQQETIPAMEDQRAPIQQDMEILADERRLSQMLDRVGLTDHYANRDEARRQNVCGNSEYSGETQLGSLDRTEVDLGDSETVTDKQIFLKREWGTRGSMIKIVQAKKRHIHPLTVAALVNCGPTPSDMRHLVAALLFSSLLKLKEVGLIVLHKDKSQKIIHISLGPGFLP